MVLIILGRSGTKDGGVIVANAERALFRTQPTDILSLRTQWQTVTGRQSLRPSSHRAWRCLPGTAWQTTNIRQDAALILTAMEATETIRLSESQPHATHCTTDLRSTTLNKNCRSIENQRSLSEKQGSRCWRRRSGSIDLGIETEAMNSRYERVQLGNQAQ